MKQIHHLINLLKRVFGYKAKDWDLVGSGKFTLVNELLKISISNSELRDEEAAHVLMRTDIKDPNYRRINSKLTNTLFGEVLRFTPTSPRFPRYLVNYYQDHKLVAILTILKRLNQVDLCFYLAKKLHRRSRLFHFTEIRLETSKYLLQYYSSIKPHYKKSDLYANDHSLALEILNLENTLEAQMYVTTSSILKNENDIKNELEMTLEYLESFEDKIGVHSVKFHLFYYCLKGVILEELGQFKSALDASRLGLRYFEKIKYEYNVPKMVFLRSMTQNYLNLGYHTEAIQTIEKSLTFPSTKNINWFNLKVTLIKLLCRKVKLQEALNHYLDLRDYKQFDSLPTHTKSQFNQLELLFFYLQEKGEVQSDIVFNSKSMKKFINTLYNEEGIDDDYSKILASLIAIHFKNKLVFTLSESDKEKYTGNRLNISNPFFRRNCFVRMLLIVIENDYHPAAIRRETSHLEEKLFNAKDNDTQISIDHELVPYEYLWKVVKADFEESDVVMEPQY